MEKIDNSNLQEQNIEDSDLVILTKENIEKIKHINDLLKKEEIRILPYAQKLHETLKLSKEKKEIEDYNFKTVLEVYSVDDDCNKRHNTEEGDPIFMEHFNLFTKCSLDANDMVYSENWNLYCKGNHPLANIPFCYSMHCIRSHSGFTWQDILDISHIWIDLKVDYQFMVCYVDSYFEQDEINTDS